MVTEVCLCGSCRRGATSQKCYVAINAGLKGRWSSRWDEAQEDAGEQVLEAGCRNEKMSEKEDDVFRLWSVLGSDGMSFLGGKQKISGPASLASASLSR